MHLESGLFNNIKDKLIISITMGGCTSNMEDPKVYILKKSYQTFSKLDRNKNNQITSQEIENHFGNYSSASAKIMLRQIDFNNDGMITKNEWLGYWELVRRSGYKPADIIKQLNEIENGTMNLNFGNIGRYQADLPRSTVVNSIVEQFKLAPPQGLPFSLEN